MHCHSTFLNETRQVGKVYLLKNAELLATPHPLHLHVADNIFAMRSGLSQLVYSLTKEYLADREEVFRFTETPKKFGKDLPSNKYYCYTKGCNRFHRYVDYIGSTQ